ncbi:MAG: EAL domain-containing protein [Congregibacter sp.]
MKILVVDDDVVDRKLVKRALNSAASYNHDIAEATSVSEGLSAIEREHFDAVLLDYNMPEVDGIEMIKEIRAQQDLGNTAILVISASEDSDLALACIEAGAQDFLPKNEITHTKLNKAILHAKKRFEIEQRMHDSYLAVKQMAERDALTGLSNRYHFEEILKVTIATNRRAHNSVALLALDLDNFKHINDTLGHDYGDRVLVEAVDRIKGCLRHNEGFARLGGDEFAVVLGGIGTNNEVSTIAKRILAQFEAPFTMDGNEVNCGVSIGAALCPTDATDPNELMKCADIAMYRSKQSGKHSIRFYEARYQTEFQRRVDIQNEISTILRESAFRLFYQPIFCAKNNTITGAEALIRWPESEQMYFPDEFIPIAEEARIIDSLGRWIIRTAVEQLARWRAEHDAPLTISINISPVQLQDSNFLTYLTTCIEQAAIAPQDVILEITETALIRDSERISQSLSALSQHGFKIALDDFGTGYSSISYLMDYPIDIVKLDKSMQASDDSQSKRKRVLAGLGMMLRELEFEVVAEGIETEAQKLTCQNLGMDKLQGYLLARPMPAEQMSLLLQQSEYTE